MSKAEQVEAGVSTWEKVMVPKAEGVAPSTLIPFGKLPQRPLFMSKRKGRGGAESPQGKILNKLKRSQHKYTCPIIA
jgi:hypothetical protein